MRSKMQIDVDFLAGTEIRQAIEEAKQKAGKLDVAYICFNFNGVSFSIGKNADVKKAIEQYETGDSKYGICEN